MKSKIVMFASQQITEFNSFYNKTQLA